MIQKMLSIIFIKKLIFSQPFEFLRKIILFLFWYDKNYILNYENMIMKYITIYYISPNCKNEFNKNALKILSHATGSVTSFNNKRILI